MAAPDESEVQRMQKKIRITSDLFELAMKIKTHQLRLKQPNLDDNSIKQQVLALIEKGCR